MFVIACVPAIDTGMVAPHPRHRYPHKTAGRRYDGYWRAQCGTRYATECPGADDLCVDPERELRLHHWLSLVALFNGPPLGLLTCELNCEG